MADTCKGKTCPLLSALKETACIEHRCAHYQQLMGDHPQTGEALGYFDCAIRWHNVLLVENANQVRQHAAAVESMRNEARKDSAALGASVLAVAEAVGKVVPAKLCVYEVRNRRGDLSLGAPVETWCRAHGFDCPNAIEGSNALPLTHSHDVHDPSSIRPRVSLLERLRLALKGGS